MKTISRNEVKELIGEEKKAVVVEALPENFYAVGHLPGAVNIPPGKVVELAPQLLPEKNQTIIVYCSGPNCQNSLLTSEDLSILGYTDVRRYIEGKEDWRGAGLPLQIGFV